MFEVYTQNGELVEAFISIDDAIQTIIGWWHEDAIPMALTIRANGMTEAVMCPIGSDGCKVVRNNGDTMDWEHIHYVTVDGVYQYTSAYNNGIEYKIKNN